MSIRLVVFGLVLGFTFLLAWKGLDEGMWLLIDLPIDTMKSKGLQLRADQIFHPTDPSLEDAIVLLGAGSGSYVSSDGLLLTNHHVAYDGVRSVSTVEKDYLRDGFLASGRAEELPMNGMTAAVTKNIVDVTDEISSGIEHTLDAQEMRDSIAARSKEIQERYHHETGLEAKIVQMYYGLKYYVFLSEQLLDVRLVYAPPSSIGKYGGNVDNWMWPRHTGDFSILRAYTAPDGRPAPYSADNVPYHPVKYLPISGQGVEENLFVMAMGFPGSTYRWRSSYSLALAFEETYPMTKELFGIRIELLKRRALEDRAVGLKLASKLRRLENTYKYVVGMLEGMKRYRLLEWKESEERKLISFIASDPELQERYGSVFFDIRDAYTELRKFNQKLRMLRNITSASDMVQLANRFNRFARRKAEKEPTEQDVNELKKFARSVHGRADLKSEKEILAALLIRALDLPAEQKLGVVEEIVNGRKGEGRIKAVERFVENLYRKSRLSSVSGCDKLMMKKPRKIQGDRLIRFVLQLQNENHEVAQESARFNILISRLRKRLAEVRTKWSGQITYPDANRTLRLTFGTVKGLNSRDAVHYDWVTRLSGVMEKETGEDPFTVPKKLRELWQKKDFGPYYDADIKGVPVCFLSDTDVSGGNSGSPILNGRGEVVGVIFDGNWEGIIGDFRFDLPLNRTISVESRYILFILEKFARAENILKELEIR